MIIRRVGGDLVMKETIPSVNIFAMSVSILVLITHQKNIERLLRGTESKVYLLSKRSPKG